MNTVVSIAWGARRTSRRVCMHKDMSAWMAKQVAHQSDGVEDGFSAYLGILRQIVPVNKQIGNYTSKRVGV